MISKKMQTALNKQINAELYSSYLYLSMAAWAHSQNLSGTAAWMEVQAKEENAHGMKLYGQLLERGGAVTLEAIAKPPAAWKSALQLFTVVAEHEAHVTSLINGLMDVAIAEKDYASVEFLNWFVKEQVEEEANAALIVAKLEMVGDSKSGLLMLDGKIGKRGQS